MMEKLIKHPKFTCGVRQIHHASFVIGEEASRARLKAD